MRDEFLSLLITLLVQAHFMIVLWSHYKNSHLTQAKGGCMPNVSDDLAMRGV